MNFDLDDILNYLRENLLAVLPIAIIVLLLLGYLFFTVRTVLPRWQLRAALVTQSEAVEAAYAERSQQQQAGAGQIRQQITAAQANFDQSVNQFLTETEAAAFLDGLYDSAAAFGVSIVDLQARAVPQAVPINGEKPVYDTRHFHLVVEGDITQLNGFVSGIEETAVPSINLQNLLVTQGAEGFRDVLTLDLQLFTSPYARGAAVAQLPAAASPTPVSPVATSVAPTATPTMTPAPDVSGLIAQLDAPWQAEDWPTVISLIQEIRQEVPGTPEMVEKLYAARVNFGYQLAGVGDVGGAAEQFEQALALVPGGTEAEAGLQSLFTPQATATPSVTIHIVQRGDTLYSIARRYGSTVDAVKSANGLVGNNISPGQQLIIPSSN